MTPAVGTRLVSAGALVALFANAAPALAGNGGFAPVPPESPNAQDITWTWWFVSIFVAAIFLLVQGLLIVFIIRYRRGKRARDADGPQVHGSTRLEAIWTVAPVFILAAIGVAVFSQLPGLRDVPSASAAGEKLEITVEGRQYYWQYVYPNGVVAVERLRAPVGVPVDLTVVAPDTDVIHSWWIPALGGKIDAIPGIVNSTWFQAERPGIFRGQCAELCGLAHANMLAEVEVLPVDEFDTWLDEQERAQSAGTSDLGEQTYAAACATCHGLDGQGGVAVNAPRLAGSALVADANAVEEIVRNGRNLMPPVGSGWSDRQMDAVTDYLAEELRDGSQG
jgi:cytochrome c oxidase subunit 2